MKFEVRKFVFRIFVSSALNIFLSVMALMDAQSVR